MKYELRIAKAAARQLASLPARARERIAERVAALSDWPDHGQDVKALKGQLAGCYRLRCGNHRVLFHVLDDPKVVVVEQIGARGSVYR